MCVYVTITMISIVYRTQEYSKTIGTLTEQLRVSREELDNANGRLNEPSPVLLRLQEELRNIKVKRVACINIALLDLIVLEV